MNEKEYSIEKCDSLKKWQQSNKNKDSHHNQNKDKTILQQGQSSYFYFYQQQINKSQQIECQQRQRNQNNKEDNNKNKDNNIIDQYIPQMLQFMFEREQKYLRNIKQMREQYCKDIQNRRWAKIEVMAHYNYNNWRRGQQQQQQQQQQQFQIHNFNTNDDKNEFTDRSKSLVDNSNINLKEQQQEDKEQLQIKAQTLTKQHTIVVRRLQSDSSSGDNFVDRKRIWASSKINRNKNKDINFISVDYQSNHNNNNDTDKDKDNENQSNIIFRSNDNNNSNSNTHYLLQSQHNHYHQASEYISNTDNKYYGQQYQQSFRQQQQQYQQQQSRKQKQSDYQQSQQQSMMMIDWFNKMLAKINNKLIEHVIELKQQKLSGQQKQKGQSKNFHTIYKGQTTTNQSNRQAMSKKSFTNIFMKVSLLINKCCDKLQLLNNDSIFTAHHLFWLFLQHHPQLKFMGTIHKSSPKHFKYDPSHNQNYQQQPQQQQQQLQIFITQLLSYIAIASIFISAKYHQIYHPTLIQVMYSSNQNQQQLNHDILANIEVKMQHQLVLGKWNFIIVDFQPKWINFVIYILGWYEDDHLQDNDRHGNKDDKNNILDKENDINKTQSKQSKQTQKEFQKQQQISDILKTKITQIILQTGMLNIHLYQYPISKKVGTVMTMYLKYWLKKQLNNQIIIKIWNITNLNVETYKILQQEYFITLNYCQDNQLNQIKHKYFQK